jgi:hypothetical protein
MIESVEYIGFIATAFILASFVMDGNKLRVINSIGAGIWFIYAIFTNGYSIMFLNICVILIHSYKLWKSSKKSIIAQSVEKKSN